MSNDDQQQPPRWEEAFAGNLRRLRELAGWSQSELARRAAAEGLAFHQQTVQRIERGERPVRLNEAMVLVEIVGSDLEQMLEPVNEEMAASELIEAARTVAERVNSFDDAVGLAAKRAFDAMLLLEERVENYRTAAAANGREPSADLLRDVEFLDHMLDRCHKAAMKIRKEFGEIGAIVSHRTRRIFTDGEHR